MQLKRLTTRLEHDSLLRTAIVHTQVLPGRAAVYQKPKERLAEPIEKALKAFDVSQLYAHQAVAIDIARHGKDFVVVTPTASGKSLTYILPILDLLTVDPHATTLLLFPLKALEQDQAAKLRKWQEELRGKIDFSLGVFDGDTPPVERQRIKKHPPNILITNPDMLHQGILAYHHSWEKYLRQLKYIVIDELHAYRGVFGSHILQVLRRLRRLLHYYGAKPQFICLSATIANPLEFASILTGKQMDIIEDSGAPSPPREFWLVNATDTSLTNAVTKLLTHSLDAGLKTIAFTKSRVATEIIYRSLKESRPELAKRVSSYRAGFLPEERRRIEKGLASGDLDGVVSTSALELGIDIGGLDVCILAGFPGSMMSLWQRAGRVGRRENRAAVILVAGSDQLDQYFAREAESLLTRPLERALINRDNEHILRQHLPAAAAEIPLMADDPYIEVAEYSTILAELEHERALLKSASGKQWFPGRPRPHAAVDLRNVGGVFGIIDTSILKHAQIGTISGNSVFRECHDGAVYLHRGEPYCVTSLDIVRREVHVTPHQSPTYTMVRTQKETEILDVRETRTLGSFVARLGVLKVTEHFVAYERRKLYSQELLSVEPLTLPPQSFATIGCWIELPASMQEVLAETENHFMGSIHAIEHAAISLTPLLALCDRNDLGGISFTRHPQLPNGAVFFYDGYPGGVGISECMYDALEDLLAKTGDLISHCTCLEGCPSCVQSPKCGSGNRPLDKVGATRAIQMLLCETQNAAEPVQLDLNHTRDRVTDSPVWAPQDIPADKRVLVFDLETQLSADDVGGWKQARQMRLAVAAVWDSVTGETTAYLEHEVEELLTHLKRADLVCGYNVKKFDYEVLRGYTFESLHLLPTLDLLEVIVMHRGGRLKLDSIANATLGVRKSADGLQSLTWFKSGEIERVSDYCKKDVELTRDILRYILAHGCVFFHDKSGESIRLPINISIERYLGQNSSAVS